MKRILLAFWTVVSLLSMSQPQLISAATIGTPPSKPTHITLTWSDSPATTQTITWRAEALETSGVIEFGPQRGTLSRVSATCHDLSTDSGKARLFTGMLSGLKPNTMYQYRVGNGVSWSKTCNFTTAPAKPDSFKFLVFGDSQSGIPERPIYEPWRTTLHNAYAANPEAKFFVNLGDLVEIGRMSSHWDAWFDAAEGVIDRIPAMPVQGNHETYLTPDEELSDKPDAWIGQFSLPQNGPAGLKNQVYSYDYGNVHFVVLDSQEEEESPRNGDILRAQREWLESDLSRSKALWKIVMFHKTPYYVKKTRTNEEIKRTFCPIFDKHHVDLVLNGHDHAVAHTYPIAHDTLMRRPSEGTVYYMAGRSGNKSYSDLFAKYWTSFFFNPSDQPDYIVATISRRKLVLRAFKQDGRPIDTFSIDKDRDATSDKPWTRYPKPTLASYGKPVTTGHVPVWRNEKWFVDPSAISLPELKLEAGEVELAGKKTEVGAEDQLADGGTTLISTTVLRKLGYSVIFHKETNILDVFK